MTFTYHPGRKSEPTRDIRISTGTIPAALTCGKCGSKYATSFALQAHFGTHRK
ncbi:MAG: hypothetical protein MK134_03260 [Dehalococcoidia bacterium]|nr:hypothetical protein [Dehalococcoidia bacterium]